MASTNHPSAILALIAFAIKSTFKLIEVIQSRPNYSKPWRDLVKELESTNEVFASLRRLVTASTYTNFLRLASPLKECGTACNKFKEILVKAHAQSNEKDICGKNTPNSGNSPSRVGHVETFRRHLSGYKSTFEVVLSASTIQTPLTTTKDLVNIKTLINCTIEDIDDLDNEEANIVGLPPLSNERASVASEISGLGVCRDICISFRELVYQIEEAFQHSKTNTCVILDQDTQEMADLLSEIHSQPISSHLSAYFETLKDDSRKWDIHTFIEGVQYLAKIVGPEKGKYYEDSLNGLHYPPAFAELWNQTYHQQRIDSLNFAVCPPGWSSGIENCRLDLTYEGDKPLSHGLNELLQGPTTMDCGMFCQLLQWMAIRYMTGDGLFDRFFQFQKGEFTISQQCYSPANLANKTGNLLFPFYDRPIHDNVGYALESQPRIKMRAFFNNPRYLSKHPKGTGRLQNVIQIDDHHIIFRPGAPRNILSREEVDCALMTAYNAPRNLADEEEISFYTKNQDNLHPHIRKPFGLLVEEAKGLADHTLNETEWKDTKADREKMAHGYHLILNFQRLKTSLEKSRDGYFNGTMGMNIIKRAEELQRSALRKKLNGMWQ